jgi:pimeloyl-ACP methyl ester carboxylesterase
MVAIGLDEGGVIMTQSPNGFSVIRAPADTAGAPTVLLIHGFLDDAMVWDGLIESLGGEVGAGTTYPASAREADRSPMRAPSRWTRSRPRPATSSRQSTGR